MSEHPKIFEEPKEPESAEEANTMLLAEFEATREAVERLCPNSGFHRNISMLKLQEAFMYASAAVTYSWKENKDVVG